MISNNHSFEVHDEEIEEKRGNLLTAAFKKEKKNEMSSKISSSSPKGNPIFFFI